MTAKQYLRQLSKIELNIRLLTEELEERRTRLTSTAAPPLGDKVQSSPKGDTFASAMAVLADKDLQRRELIVCYEMLRDEIVEKILGLDNSIYSQVLYERYVQRKSWDSISEDMHYSLQHIFRLHGNALVAFAVKYL